MEIFETDEKTSMEHNSSAELNSSEGLSNTGSTSAESNNRTEKSSSVEHMDIMSIELGIAQGDSMAYSGRTDHGGSMDRIGITKHGSNIESSDMGIVGRSSIELYSNVEHIGIMKHNDNVDSGVSIRQKDGAGSSMDYSGNMESSFNAECSGISKLVSNVEPSVGGNIGHCSIGTGNVIESYSDREHSGRVELGGNRGGEQGSSSNTDSVERSNIGSITSVGRGCTGRIGAAYSGGGECRDSVDRGGMRQTQCQPGGSRRRRFGREIVEFSVKGPVSVSLDEEQVASPGCSIIDLLFPEPLVVGELVFRNYYCAKITILVQYGSTHKTASGGGKVVEDPDIWQVGVADRVLMPDPHMENGSHDLFSIAATESLTEWNNLIAMRLVLRQPSPSWRTFHVEEINVYRDLPRWAPRPTHHTHVIGGNVRCQEFCPLLAMVRKHTIDALKINIPGNDPGTSKDNHTIGPAYEFFNLPQL